MSALNDRTPAGLLAYCDYLMSKGYATAAQVNPWKTAIQKVFETVEGEGWHDLDLSTIDIDEYGARFQTLAGAQYKAESITAYKRRVSNAIEAQEHYLTTGRPPTFRQGAKKADRKEATNVVPMDAAKARPSATAEPTPAAGMHEFEYPLGDGRFVKLTMPPRMKADDINRICAFIRTLQDESGEQRQIPRRTGEDQSNAA
jgi:GH24 family phage-related lysozyme (muramidase)